jgi:DNA polymerase III subunit delta
MRITTEQLSQHLARGLLPLYVVHGAETLLALEASDRIRAAARSLGHAERELLVADTGFRWGELALAAGAQSLFAERRLLEVRIPTGKPGVEGGAALQDYCARLPADTVTLVELPELDWRTQQSSWFAALEAAGVAVEARTVARRALPQWLSGRLKAQGQHAERETLEFIAERVEGNLMAAHQEVQKLALLYPAGPLSAGAVREAVARSPICATARAASRSGACACRSASSASSTSRAPT